MHPAKCTLAVLAITIAASIVGAGGANLTEPGEPRPLWHVDLYPQGLTHHSMGMFMFSSHDHPESSRNREAVAVNSAGQVAVVFATFQERNGGGYEPGTAKLHLLVYDPVTGKPTFTKEWSAPQASKIVGVPDISTTFSGNFLLEYAGQLTLYSPSLQIIQSAQIEGAGPRFSYWASPDGRYAFFAGKKDRINILTIVDTETLQVLRSMNADRPISAASSRHLAAWSFPVPNDPASRSLGLQSTNSGWEQFYSDAGCKTQDGAGVGFLNDTVLIISSCNKFLVINAEHKVLFSEALSKRETIDGYLQVSFSSATDGQRFGVAVDKPKRDPWWTGDPGTGPVPERLMVYDASASGRAVASFELHGRYETDFDRLSFALSPDGMSLALIRDTSLEFVPLPPRPTHWDGPDLRRSPPLPTINPIPVAGSKPHTVQRSHADDEPLRLQALTVILSGSVGLFQAR